jgi:cysteine dioxygenase
MMEVENSKTQEIKSLGDILEKSMAIGKLDFDNIPVPKDLSELVAHLRHIFSSDTVNVDYVSKLLKNYKSNPKDWRKYAKYDPHK